MFPMMCSQLPCMNIEVSQVTSQSWPTAVPGAQELTTSHGW